LKAFEPDQPNRIQPKITSNNGVSAKVDILKAMKHYTRH
jgi:hypothetical protein